MGCRGSEEARQRRNDQRPRPGAPVTHAYWSGDQNQVGAFLHGYESLWLPAKLLQGDEQLRLVNALFAASRIGKNRTAFQQRNRRCAGRRSGPHQGHATNPAVVDAFALVIIRRWRATVLSGSGAARDGHDRRPQQRASD